MKVIMIGHSVWTLCYKYCCSIIKIAGLDLISGLKIRNSSGICHKDSSGRSESCNSTFCQKFRMALPRRLRETSALRETVHCYFATCLSPACLVSGFRFIFHSLLQRKRSIHERRRSVQQRRGTCDPYTAPPCHN